jgi:cephalosporin-C deacetylase-like acetyl esterase
LAKRVEQIQRHEPANGATLDAWQQQRLMLREQLFDMLGLWPLPPRTELNATITSTIEREGVVVEKLFFQSRPGLYVTANFFRPREVATPLPTILYLAGHARAVEAGVSLGNKVSYHHHACWFARNGYCCLMIDTLQLGEIEGLHHGTHREGMWWWIARGYTPAGVEAWNAIRALDYLESRPEVDTQRIGVTGRSGGGAYTWFVSALDDRPACVVPVAGITDLEDHVIHDCIRGHCDCMFMVNTRHWDFATLAALVAPRPCLLANSDKDAIFPLRGVVRVHDRMRQIYDLYGAGDKLGLFICEGPHADNQELQVAAFRWMNRWLREDTKPITADAEKLFPLAELKVLDELPTDRRNEQIHEEFVPLAEVGAPPKSLTQWNERRAHWLQSLSDRCFAAWPARPSELDPRTLREQRFDGHLLRTVEFTSEDPVRITALLATPLDAGEIERVRLIVADDATWQELQTAFESRTGPANIAPQTAVVLVAPRGWGPLAWPEDQRLRTHLLRSLVLCGTTLDAGRIWDVRRAVHFVREAYPGVDEIALEGSGPAAGVALYAAVFEPQVTKVHLTRLAASHRDGPILLQVLRVLDLPQGLALLFPRRVTLVGTDPEAWSWAIDVSRLYDSTPLMFE